MFLFEGDHMGFFFAVAFGLGLGDEGDHFFVGFGNDLGNSRYGVFPIFQQHMAKVAVRIGDVFFQQRFDKLLFVRVGQVFQLDQVGVALGRF